MRASEIVQIKRTEIIPSNRIITGYERIVWEDHPHNRAVVPELYNYEQYQLSILSTRIQPLVDSIAHGCQITFNLRYVPPLDSEENEASLKIKNGYMSVDLVLFRNNFEEQNISQEVIRKIQLEMERVKTSKYRNHVLLLRSNTDIARNGYYLPAQWLNTVVPCIRLPEKYHAVATGEGLLVQAEEDYVWLMNSLVDSLTYMFSIGVIATSDLNFVKRWQLVPYLGEQLDVSRISPLLISSTVPGVNFEAVDLYRPQWNNAKITRNPALFLIQRQTNMKYYVNEEIIDIDNYETLLAFLNKTPDPKQEFYELMKELFSAEPDIEVYIEHPPEITKEIIPREVIREIIPREVIREIIPREVIREIIPKQGIPIEKPVEVLPHTRGR